MKKKQLLSLILVMSMGISMAACGTKSSEDDDNIVSTGTEQETESSASVSEYDTKSKEIYDEQLGDFYNAYQEALGAENVSERYALMAVSEAKLLESAVMLPLCTRYGYSQLTRRAPHSWDYALWGNDYVRFHQALVTTEFITAEDGAKMNEEWAKLRGTGKYAKWAKEYLEEKGYKLKDTLSIKSPVDPVTWDVLGTSLASDTEAIVNTYDGLVEYDEEGTLQPALAESYEVSDDGLTYTFKIRKGQKWVDSQGREVDDVKADDFVAGMQHMMDAKAGLEYLVEGVIVGASDYINGKTTNFEDVGVKAVDDYTLEYTLEEKTSYFTTMLGYSIFAPMSRTYFESMGGKFGAEYEKAKSSADYKYGSSPDTIAYCGPYIVTNCTAKSTIKFEANESYWNKDNINIKTLTWLFNDGSDPKKSYEDVKAGTIDYADLTNSTIATSKEEGLFDKYAITSPTDATSYVAFYNLNRQAFANANDSTKAVSSETDEDKAKTNTAMNNVHFRRALSYAVDRASYNAQAVGEELKYNSLRNTYTPGNFVSLEEDTTIKINGEDKEYKAGTYFGQIVQDQIDADGVKVKVWDKDGANGAGSSDGFDGWYNVDNAREELDAAIKELSDLTIDKDNPVIVELPFNASDQNYTNKANAYKKSVEDSLEGKVIVKLVECASTEEWLYSGYYTSYGYEQNYDIFDLSGWGPDYGDPQTYLNTFLPDYAGYTAKCIGLF